LAFHLIFGSAASLTHKKKKKKKKKSGKKWRLDPTTTAKLVPTGKFPLGLLIVVTDTWPGSSDDLWLCSRAAELTAAAPAVHLLFLT